MMVDSPEANDLLAANRIPQFPLCQYGANAQHPLHHAVRQNRHHQHQTRKRARAGKPQDIVAGLLQRAGGAEVCEVAGAVWHLICFDSSMCGGGGGGDLQECMQKYTMHAVTSL